MFVPRHVTGFITAPWFNWESIREIRTQTYRGAFDFPLLVGIWQQRCPTLCETITGMSLLGLSFPKTAIMDYWPLITFQEAELIGCNETRLRAKIQERYGVSEQSARDQITAFTRSYDSSGQTRTRLTEYGHLSK